MGAYSDFYEAVPVLDCHGEVSVLGDGCVAGMIVLFCFVLLRGVGSCGRLCWIKRRHVEISGGGGGSVAEKEIDSGIRKKRKKKIWKMRKRDR